MPQSGNSLTTRSLLDNFIIGFLILFAIVFVMELMLLVPCGGSWADLSTCENLPAAAAAMWEPYYKVDPLFKEMPTWYAAIMNVQDALFNPWWLLSLFFFWTGRQETSWYRFGTFLVTGFITGTMYISFANWLGSPLYSTKMIIGMVLINGPWLIGPWLFAWRLRPRGDESEVIAGRTGSSAAGIGLMLLPTVIYIVFEIIAFGINWDQL